MLRGSIPEEVFLSHSSQNADFATRLVEVIRRHAVPVWYSPTNITGAQQWHDEIGRALKRCDWFVVILSPASVESMWVKRELLYALQQQRYERKIVPILHEGCEYEKLSWVLDSSQFVDYRTDFAEGCKELLQIWGLGYQPAEK